MSAATRTSEILKEGHNDLNCSSLLGFKRGLFRDKHLPAQHSISPRVSATSMKTVQCG